MREQQMAEFLEELVESYEVKLNKVHYVMDFITYDLDLVLCLN